MVTTKLDDNYSVDYNCEFDVETDIELEELKEKIKAICEQITEDYTQPIVINFNGCGFNFAKEGSADGHYTEGSENYDSTTYLDKDAN